MSLFKSQTRSYRDLESTILKLYFENRKRTYADEVRKVDVDGITHMADPNSMAMLLTIEQFLEMRLKK